MTAITGVSDRTFGLFLNMGANLAPTTAGVFDLTLREADAADAWKRLIEFLSRR